MGDAGRQRARTAFTREQMIKKIVTIYEEIVHEKTCTLTP